MTEQEMRAAAALEDVCRYIAACYYEPEPAFEEEGLFSSMEAAAALADERLVPYARRLGDEFRGAGAGELLLDYTRLFLGPTHILANPYGSVWLEGGKTLMGDSTMGILDLYQEAGFEIDEAFLDLPDHVAVELEFLYLLIYRENGARMAGDGADLESILDLKGRFLAEHLGRWIGKFAAAVKAGAGSDFYRQLAEMTELFVGIQTERTGRL